MTPRHRLDVALVQLAKVFGKALDDDMLDSYAAALSRELATSDGPDLVERACQEAARTEQFFPRPKTLLRIMDALDRRSTSPRQTLPETREVNGRVEQLFQCRECEDTGWRYVSLATGAYMSLGEVRDQMLPTGQICASRCPCGKVRAQSRSRDRASYEQTGAA
jgi:hypothetical protein